jgi:general secretion pathway protein A
MIAERTLAQAAHAWGAQGIPFNDEPKTELFRTASMDRATTLLNQSVALRSVMLLSGENGVGKSALAGRWLRSLEPKVYFPVCITQASLTGIGLLALFLQKLGKAPKHQRSASLKLLEEAFGELGRLIPVLLLDEAQNYAMSALEEVRMLLGLNLPEQPAFALILVGDSYLLSTLRLRSVRLKPPASRPNPTVEPAPDPDIDDSQRQRIRHQLRIFRQQLGRNHSAF